MIDLIVGAATLVPSLYWTAVIAASVKDIADEDK